MKTKLMMIGALAAACAVNELAAMPTAEETRRAEPVVKKLLASEREALKAGRKSRSEVAVAALKRAADAKTEAEKLLLMKGAFALYVQDGNLEKAAETMNAIKKAIPDVPAQSISNIVETSLNGAPKNVDGARLYKLLDEAVVGSGKTSVLRLRCATVDGYTWTCRVRNGEATIVAEKDGKPSCAVSPAPTGDVSIPATLNGVKVTRIGMAAFKYCKELTSVSLPAGVKTIGRAAFLSCENLTRVSIPNGVTRPRIAGADRIREKWGLEKDGYLLYLSRLVPEKGLGYLVRAFQKLDTDKKLVIAGGDSDAPDFVREIKALAASDPRILFTGFVQGQELEELYSNAYLYLLPSDVEGMPLSLLEAMSYGNCCVTSDIRECTDVTGKWGFSFEKGNEDALRELLQELCGDPGKVREIRAGAADAVCGKYSWEDAAEKNLKVYRRVLAKGRI